MWIWGFNLTFFQSPQIMHMLALFPISSINPYRCSWVRPPTYPNFPNTPPTFIWSLLPHLWASIYPLRISLPPTFLSNIQSKPMWTSRLNTHAYSQPTCISMGLGFNIRCTQVLPFRLSLSSAIQPHPYCFTTWCISGISFSTKEVSVRPL